MNIDPGGEQDPDNYLLDLKQSEVNPGLMLGKDFKGFHEFFLGTYVGAKYRFGQEQEEHIRNMQVQSSSWVYERWGWAWEPIWFIESSRATFLTHRIRCHLVSSEEKKAWIAQ